MTETLTTIETALKLAGGRPADECRAGGKIYNALARVLKKSPDQFPSQQLIVNRRMVAPSEVAEWYRFYRPADSPPLSVKVLYNNPKAKDRLQELSRELGATGPAEVLQWWIIGKLSIEGGNPEPEPLAYPWKAFSEDMTWKIQNKQTGATVKIGRVSSTGRGVNYYDRAVKEADRRNRSLLIEGD